MAARRLLITPTPEVLALLDEIKELTNQPRAAVVSEILTNVLPIMSQQLEALRYVHQGRFEEAQALMSLTVATNINKATQGQLELDKAIRSSKTAKAKTKTRKGRPPSV